MAKIDLGKIPTKQIDSDQKVSVKLETQELFSEIIDYQRKMYADGRYSLLVIFQGMDASGKDGATRKVFGGVSPIGIKVHSFKKPTDLEFAHDFLWRVHQHVPEKGMIQVFNRSHYEDILVPTVGEYLPEETIGRRYNHINNFESLLEDNKTVILKFYLHTSKEEQFERLTERVENPLKHWKHNDGDWETRKKWDEYRTVYERIFEKCDGPEWHIVPADRNWEKENYIAKTVVKALKKMDLRYPDLESELFPEKTKA